MIDNLDAEVLARQCILGSKGLENLIFIVHFSAVPT
jgi:hypothetical protein